MFAVFHTLGMLVVDLFKSRVRLERREPVSPSSAQYRLAAGASPSSSSRQQSCSAHMHLRRLMVGAFRIFPRPSATVRNNAPSGQLVVITARTCRDRCGSD